jgi:hypothetical protein
MQTATVATDRVSLRSGSPTPNPLTDSLRFEAWLKSKLRSEPVGEPRNGKRCPLAMFIVADRQAAFVNLPDEVGFVVDGQFHLLPDWASDFIHRIDGTRRTEIPTWLALSVLKASQPSDFSFI